MAGYDNRGGFSQTDFPRLAEGLPLAAFDAGSLFGGAEHGYTDYPAAEEAAAQA